MKARTARVAVLGAGLAGSCAALDLAHRGYRVTVFDREYLPMSCASLHNEGKLHLGYVYALDRDRSTHKKMIEGSLQFRDILQSLTGIDKRHFQTSTPFHYGEPGTTMLSLDQVVRHFAVVDAAIQTFLSENGKEAERNAYFPCTLLDEASVSLNYRRTHFEGVIQTPEIALNPVQIANFVGTSLLVHNHIEFRRNCTIRAVSSTPGGGFRIAYTAGDQPAESEFDACINCLWEERIAMDEMLGIVPRKQSLTRYKATLNFYEERKDFEQTPSVTHIVGPYGDVVNYRSGDYYLSWYPECKVGESDSTDLGDLKARVGRVDRESMLRESIRALSELMPGIARFSDIADHARVGGGFICGWAKTDITDRDSGLHKRSDIGVEVHGRWLSVNTGKYCTAPLYGRQASEMLIDML